MKTSQTTRQIKIKAPRIVELEPKTALCLSFTGEYSGIDFGAAFAQLWSEIKTQKLYSAGIEHLCIFYDDPKVTEQSQLRTDVCLVVRKPACRRGPVDLKTIAGGRYAVFTHIGPYDQVGPFYNAIFGEWLPSSGLTLRNEPLFEKYVNNPACTAPEKLKTEMYIPIV